MSSAQKPGYGIEPQALLADDHANGRFLGRAWIPESLSPLGAGPSPVLVAGDTVVDVASIEPTMSGILEAPELLSDDRLSRCPTLGSVGEILANTLTDPPDDDLPVFLAPADLQSIKACGVTFACSMLERIIEEQAHGDAAKAEAVRREIEQLLPGDLASVVPGSREAETLKAVLQRSGLWSQYLEVGIGPDAEVFTKAQPMSAVGTGASVGIHRASSWNNPEPEVVLAVNSRGEIVGATLGNDVNLRDIEGRSALLLGKAKDNNASCAIGPFVRLFDEGFRLDDVRRAEVRLEVRGPEGFLLRETSPMSRISRDVTNLVAQTIGPHHQYPDGLLLFTGTLFAPTRDRDEAGSGFTHRIGDVVSISSAQLGTLINRVDFSDTAPYWEFGARALMKNLAKRKLL